MAINKFLAPIFICFFFIIAGLINKNIEKPTYKVSKQDSALNISHNLLSIVDLGQRRLFADFLWISTLLESDLERYKEDDLNSWMYLRFNTISTLDPMFLKNYQFAGLYLNVAKDDLKGAEKILKKGLDIYPQNFKLLNDLAFLYAFELHDFDKAYPYYERVSKHPEAPPLIKTLLPKLKYKKTGDLSIAKEVLLSQIKNTKDENILYRLKQDLYSVQATIDLDCLNNKKDGCNKVDLNGKSYLEAEGIYKAQTEFVPYKFHIKK